MLDRLLQGQDLVEEGALEHRSEQAELLLGGHLPPLLQSGLETLHCLQGTLRICKSSHISVTAPGQGDGVDAGGDRGDEDRGFISIWTLIGRQERASGDFHVEKNLISP